MIVGVLALQGDVPEHRAAWEELLPARSVRLVRTPADLEAVDALSMPGGESTTIAALLERSELLAPLTRRIGEGLPVLATCAGLILLARDVDPVPGGRNPKTLGVLDIRLRRNDYGRQRESFEGPVDVEGLDGPPFPGVFIRAPRILSTGRSRPIARCGTEVVGVASGRVWGLTFHPELARDPRLHAAFLRAAAARKSR